MVAVYGPDGKQIRKPGVKRFTPVGNLVSIFVPDMRETPSGLALPDNMREGYVVPAVKVLAVGPECKYTKEGDWIVIGNAMAKEFMFMGDVYMVIEEKYVVGVVDKEYHPE